MSTAASVPFSIGKVTLIVHDLDRVRTFYEQVVGLHQLASDADTARLGVEGAVLLELRRDMAARPRSPRDAGLFHTAFLLPTRADLGRWLRHAARVGAPITGASDHDVSEAIYLADPEGNGIEIYADRPATSWRWRDGMVAMFTERLDLDDLLASVSPDDWQGFPTAARIGHVHLQVGALDPAEAFYAGIPSLAVTCRYPGAVFYAANRYHHHLATNIWNSRDAGKRAEPSTGLLDVEIHAGVATPLTLRDPWGTAITLVPAC